MSVSLGCACAGAAGPTPSTSRSEHDGFVVGDPMLPNGVVGRPHISAHRLHADQGIGQDIGYGVDALGDQLAEAFRQILIVVEPLARRRHLFIRKAIDRGFAKRREIRAPGSIDGSDRTVAILKPRANSA